MKNLFFGFSIFALVLMLFGCSGLTVDFSEQRSEDKAHILIALGVENENEARTVMPSHGRFCDIVLTYKKNSDSQPTTVATWKDQNDLQINPKDITLDADTYDFTIVAESYGATVSQTITQTVEADKTYKLEFNKLSPTTDSEKLGAVSVTLYFPDEIGSSVKKTTAKYDDDDEEELEIKSSYTTTSISGGGIHYTYHYYTQYSKTNVLEGEGTLIFKAYDGDEKLIATFPTYVIVQTGFLSSKTLGSYSPDSTEISNASPVKITYNSNYESEDSKTFEQIFLQGSAILGNNVMKFSVSGKKIKCWNTENDGTGIRYNAGDTPTISSDTVLYAIWIDENVYEIIYCQNYFDVKNETTQAEYKEADGL